MAVLGTAPTIWADCTARISEAQAAIRDADGAVAKAKESGKAAAKTPLAKALCGPELWRTDRQPGSSAGRPFTSLAEVSHDVGNSGVFEHGGQAISHAAILEHRMRVRGEKTVAHERAEGHSKGKQRLECRDTRQVSSWSVLLQMSDARISRPIHGLQMFFHDRPLPL
jgi:hypothetical protein